MHYAPSLLYGIASSCHRHMATAFLCIWFGGESNEKARELWCFD